MEGENPSILKGDSLISQQNQQVPQVEQTISPPLFPSSLLTNNSLIIQPTLAPPFPPHLLPPLDPPTPLPPSTSPPLSPVIQDPLHPTPRMPKLYKPYERPGTYKLPRKPLKDVANYKFKIYDKDELDDLYDPYDFDFDENTNNGNKELARYAIQKDIRYDDTHMWVDSEEDNASTVELSDDDYLKMEHDSETKADDYLNEIPEEEVEEINDKIQNYDFDLEKKKYLSKIKGKRPPKNYAVITYEKYMDKLKRERRILKYEQKILKYFYPTQFKVENYQKGTQEYYENSEFAINSKPMLSKKPELELEPHLLKPFSRKKPKKKYETLHDKGIEMKIFTGIRSSIEIHHDDGKGYAYAVLSQLCPKSWGNNELIRKPNQLSYYRDHVRLQAYVTEMKNKVSNLYGTLAQEGNTWIGERGLIFIPRIYNRLLIVFHTCQRNRKFDLYLPNT
jgi:hypothetical protein